MKQISYREMLRNPKSLFPIPLEGIEVVRQDGNFYIYSNKLSDNLSDSLPLDTEELQEVLQQAEANAAHLATVEKSYCKNCGYFKIVSPHTFIYNMDKVTDNLCGACWKKCKQDGSAR